MCGNNPLVRARADFFREEDLRFVELAKRHGLQRITCKFPVTKPALQFLNRKFFYSCTAFSHSKAHTLLGSVSAIQRLLLQSPVLWRCKVNWADVEQRFIQDTYTQQVSNILQADFEIPPSLNSPAQFTSATTHMSSHMHACVCMKPTTLTSCTPSYQTRAF